MPEKDINDYLKKQIAGNPDLNHQQKKEFLGVLEERVRVCMTLKDMTNPTYFKRVENIIKKTPGGKIRLSVALDAKPRMKFMLLAQKYNIPFTIVDNDATSDNSCESSIGMVYHFEQLLEQATREISQISE